MFTASLLHLVSGVMAACQWSRGRWWMHADHVHCLPVALGFIARSEWSHGRWWWMHADHVHCLPVALGFIVFCEWSHGRWWWMHADHVHCLPVALGFIGTSKWGQGKRRRMDADLVHSLPVPLGFIATYALIPNNLYSWFLPSPLLGNPSAFLYFPPQCNVRGNILLKMALDNNGRNDLQKDLTSAVEKYQGSGIHAKVNTLIQEAFDKYGNNVDVLCPILVDIAQQNQLSKMLDSRG
ncbi:hypothetical protein F5141DRAFT_1065201 [Pisolithus sp. B1]|nr:hypothetical protein F5141DRAFT_1065201 [Pisolithus sp. B1]